MHYMGFLVWAGFTIAIFELFGKILFKVWMLTLGIACIYLAFHQLGIGPPYTQEETDQFGIISLLLWGTVFLLYKAYKKYTTWKENQVS